MDLVNESPRVLGNRYEVGDLLGRGGMAEVHLGRDARLGRTVAIKLLRTDLARDPTFQARFRREAQSAAALNHPAIVAVYDTGEETVAEAGGGIVSLPYIVMEHVEGRTLRDILSEGRPFDINVAMDVTIGVLTALEYSHRIGIVHRDIKPANVMLTPNGEVKVMDFGIARALADASSTMTQTQAVIGTAQYLSPEQARGEAVDTRSDLYSTGCLLFELLTGRPPFVADSPVAIAYQHVREHPQPPSRIRPGIPESVDRIVLHALGKERDERYQSAAQFRADLEAARGGRHVSAPAPTANGAGATTQFIPASDATGTRAMAPVAGVGGSGSLLGGDTAEGRSPFDDGYGEGYGDYRRRGDRQPGRRSTGPIILILGAIALLALVAFVVAKLVGGNDGGGEATTATLPSVVGQAEAVAEQNLINAGFKVTKTPAESTEDQKGKVVQQSPEGGTTQTKGITVTLTIGAGPGTIAVPDVSGKSAEEAEQILREAGFTVASKEEQNTDVDPGDVIRTEPAADTQLAKGDKVTLIVSGDTAFVESFVGEDQDSATARLRELGFKVTTKLVASSEPAGTVVAQSPKGVEAKRGSTVTLSVSTGIAPTTPPPTSSPTPTVSASPSVSASP